MVENSEGPFSLVGNKIITHTGLNMPNSNDAYGFLEWILFKSEEKVIKLESPEIQFVWKPVTAYDPTNILVAELKSETDGPVVVTELNQLFRNLQAALTKSPTNH